MKAIKKFLYAIILAVVLTANAGNTITPAFKIPEGSSFSLKEVKTIPPFLYFEGKATIRAEYSLKKIETSQGHLIEVIVFPTSESLTLLPFLTDRGYDERPIEITILDSMAAVKLLLDLQQLKKFESPQYEPLIGEVEIVISDLEGGYLCNNAVFAARLVSVVLQAEKARVVPAVEKIGC